MKTIYLDGEIGPGELSAKWLRSQLAAAGGADVELRLHSTGGSVIEAFSMIDELKAYKGRVRALVSSMALSAASLVMCAADEISMTQTSYVMAHGPHIETGGGTNAERQMLSSVEEKMVQLYVESTRQPRATIARLMRNEKFLDANEALKYGFCDRVVNGVTSIAANANSALARSEERRVGKEGRFRGAPDD